MPGRRLIWIYGVLLWAPMIMVQTVWAAGDPERGRSIVTDRQRGFCLLCHSGPYPEEKFQGDLAPALNEIVQGRSANDLRQRLIDPTRFNPDTIMPRYGTIGVGERVHPQFKGQVLLQPQDIDDVVAHLLNLKP